MTEAPHDFARLALEMMLSDLDLRRVLDPDSVALRFDRACVLEALGRLDEAKQGYRETLALDPSHFGALNNLGIVLYRQGFWRAAELAYALNVARHPQNAMGHAHLARLLHVQGKAGEAVEHYEKALALDPADARAHRGLSHVVFEREDPASGLGGEQQAQAEERRPITFSEYRGSGDPVRLLVLGAVGLGNIPTKRYFHEDRFLVATLLTDWYDPEIPLPPHHLVFNAIGDADRCAPNLVAANAILTRTQAPVLNLPSHVLLSGRTANSERLGKIPDVVTPRIATFSRNLLARGEAAAQLLEARGFGWPLLLRSPGYHTGEHFIKVDQPGELASAVATLPGETLMAIEYLNAYGPDRRTRKYRVMIVNGELYPLHLAVSPDWMVHYFSADMKENADNRAEDERYLYDMEGTLGPVAMRALERLREELGLDFAGVDFALDADRRILLFEANATMLVPEPPDDPRWEYRRAPVARIVDAVRAMLVNRAGRLFSEP